MVKPGFKARFVTRAWHLNHFITLLPEMYRWYWSQTVAQPRLIWQGARGHGVFIDVVVESWCGSCGLAVPWDLGTETPCSAQQIVCCMTNPFFFFFSYKTYKLYPLLNLKSLEEMHSIWGRSLDIKRRASFFNDYKLR